MEEIVLNKESLIQEQKNKLKSLKKYESSEEFTNICKEYDNRAEEYQDKIDEELKKRWSKHRDPIYSELDMMVLRRELNEIFRDDVSNEDLKSKISENIMAITSHIILQSPDYQTFSKIEYYRECYKFYLWIKASLKNLIDSLELQEKEINIDDKFNAYTSK